MVRMTDDALTPDGYEIPASRARTVQAAALALLANSLATGGELSARDINLIMADVVPLGQAASLEDVVMLLAAMLGITTALLEHLSDDPLALVRRLTLQAQQ